MDSKNCIIASNDPKLKNDNKVKLVSNPSRDFQEIPNDSLTSEEKEFQKTNVQKVHEKLETSDKSAKCPMNGTSPNTKKLVESLYKEPVLNDSLQDSSYTSPSTVVSTNETLNSHTNLEYKPLGFNKELECWIEDKEKDPLICSSTSAVNK